ncbi:Transcriptional regulator, TetR family [Candidatus Zixiibacteriota bacterium]|nr:Transcriptional regulator, TetR family [candidate division Zixibacteria bacterium]
MERDKERTRKKIIEAAGRLLAQKGFRQLGINSVAREAKVSKVLIYRYFGGLPELLQAIAEDGNYWPTATDLVGAEINLRRVPNPEQISITILLNYLKEMRRRKLTQEIVRWELIHNNELTDRLSRIREKQRTEMLGALPIEQGKYHELDLGAAAALLHAGITFLVLHSKTAEEYLGIDLHSNFGWKRLERALESLINGYFEQHRVEKG